MKNILEFKNFNVTLKENNQKILNDINIVVKEEEFLGLVGESGSGKTALLNAIISFLDKEKFVLNGEMNFLNNEENFKEITMIFQDSINSLNPYEKIKKQLFETYLLHSKNEITKEFAMEEIKKLLLDVGLADVERILNSYPNELSGGMRQRVAIVLALCTRAKILLADEPTTSLDVVNQFKFVELLKKITKEKKLTLIYVSHDIKLLSKICERIIVLKNGKIVEENTTEEILKNPQDEYTKLLVRAAMGE